MRRPACVIDSSCVIALDHLELFPQITFLFSEVLLPKAVRKDLFKRRVSKDRVRGFFSSFAFIQLVTATIRQPSMCFWRIAAPTATGARRKLWYRLRSVAQR